ncbi:type II toxin-antitoxin system Phd/YefM family antitoxin [Caulobacter sp. DWR1-3-2b1]|uniref:type II toxin-antitoxin system Phd/YefM family antitoxin n=1 Tax=Caulobacter sp. DWR1-3-2b1 TaxID=2804670 RepID=UPI003CF3AECD
MTVVTIHYAKTHLSRLLAEVEAGGEVVIARGKTPIGRLVPVAPTRPKRVFGSMQGQIAVDEAFFEPLPDEELALWEGGDA